MEKSAIQKVNMLILLQPDLEVAAKFYTDLGFTKKFHMPEKWAEFDLNGVSFGLCPIAKETLDEKGIDPSTGFRTGIVLQVNDLKAFCDEKADDMKFLGEPVEAVHGLMVSFRDPGGNIIDLYQPTPEKVQEFVKKNADKIKEAKQAPEGHDCHDACCGKKEE